MSDYTRALHSELLTELSSRVSSWNESGRVHKKLKKLVPTLIFEKRTFPKLAKTKIAKKCNFSRFFCNFFAKTRVGMSFHESRRVRKKLEKLVLTLIFKKTDISETRENKKFGKTRLSQGLRRYQRRT
jgi:hypothetical protein